MGGGEISEKGKEAPKVDPGQQAVNTITTANNPEKVNTAVDNNQSLKTAGDILNNQTKDKKAPIDEYSKNPGNINQIAADSDIIPQALEALTYKEDQTGNIQENYSQATEVTANGEITITDKNITLYSKEEGKFSKTFFEKGKIENNTITWAVLDFTGSMKKEQIGAMIDTLRNLFDKWIITENTKINIIYNIEDQKNGNLSPTEKAKKIWELSTTLWWENLTTSFWKDGIGLKNKLLGLKLIDNNWTPVVEQWKWCTPLYATILDNLMNKEVKNATIFTDGASDIDAVALNWESEPGKEAAWDAMITICQKYNKKISLVSFNLNEGNNKKLQEMEKYFVTKWAEKYLHIERLWKTTGKDDLAKKIEDYITNSYKVQIKEDVNMVNGRKLSINNSSNADKANTVETTPITNQNVQAEYDQTTGNLSIDMSKVIPDGININNYDVTYTEEMIASIEQNKNYSIGTTVDKTYLLDVSGSMAGNPGQLMRNANLCINPSISYQGLLGMKKSIYGFNKAKPGFVENYSENIVPKDIDFNKPDNKLYGLVLKAALDYYNNLDKTGVKYQKETQDITNALEKINKNALAVEPNTVMDLSVNTIYKQVLPNIQNKTEEIKVLYWYIEKLESLWGQSFTPLIDVVGKFWEGDINTNTILQSYKNKSLDFYTDFGENSSKGLLKELYGDMMSGWTYTEYTTTKQSLEFSKKGIEQQVKNLKRDEGTSNKALMAAENRLNTAKNQKRSNLSTYQKAYDIAKTNHDKSLLDYTTVSSSIKKGDYVGADDYLSKTLKPGTTVTYINKTTYA